jgi:hypothetical protein
MTRAGFPHSDILGSRFVCQLPEAYRRLQRPSSAPSAKASTLCPYKLDHKDHSKRCSRPLCSSQATTGSGTLTPAPTHPKPSLARGGRFDRAVPARSPSHPDPHPKMQTACVATPRQQPSGCSLRTQQHAQPTPSPAATVPTRTPKGCGVLGATSSKAGHSRCSTLEHRPPLVRQGQRAWTPSPHPMTGTASARCSLERR